MKTTYYIERDSYAAAIADVVKMPVDSTRREYYVITRINVMERYRGQGLGTQILEMILADADAENVTLLLEPVPSGGLDHKELIGWYARHGFKYGAYHMRRKPQAQK